MEAIEKEVAELEKQLQEIIETVRKRGAPMVGEKARIVRLFRELQAKLAILRGVPEEEAYRQAEEATKLLGESMCIVINEQ